ncbi:H-NS histone family protein [Piscinibacter sp.]|uniref:H-NS histone family protein n=1 Tax=Piscinibacter sp. TaxID=1903157 RepID=UPI002C57AC0E|nr:H-NS histone family protein [Albitalea sp.]HUG26580.1 H-NS histone family protein [Albitalea sp.]
MKTYSAIKAEIAKLEKQAEAMRQAEVAGVIAKIKTAIEAYGLTAADLGFGPGSARPARQTKGKSGKKTSKTVGVAKYRDPKSGKTWTGRGKPPGWIAGVKNRDNYLIDGPAAADTAGATKAKRSVNGTRKAKRPSAKRSGRSRRTAQLAPLKTPAVQIESGAAAE